MAAYSWVLKECRIVDGTGRPEYRADVGIKGDGLARVGSLDASEGERSMACRGLVLAPGFIDLHSHSDLGALENPAELNKLSQGVTTEVAGNCGFSLFPITERGREPFKALVASFGKKLDPPWRTGAEFFRLLEARGIGFNYVPLVGHGLLRIGAMAFEAAPARGAPLEAMKELLAAEMESGSRGFSTGLGYAPGCFADLAELAELGKVAARYGGIYASHIRDQGRRLIESVDEALEVGREAGLPVIVSHLKAYGVSNWGMAGRVLERIERARAEGLRAMADFYPYESSSTTLMYELPDWSKEGGPERSFARLASREDRERIKAEILGRGELTWDRVVVCSVGSEANRNAVGKSIARIAGERGVEDGDAALDLLLEERGAVETVCDVMSPADVDLIASCPWTAVGSDAYALDAAAPFTGHPRNFGAFPRFFQRFVRERRLLSLEEAVRKSSALAAEFLGLADRGLVREGLAADLVLFDPERIEDRADYLHPGRAASGIEAVFVNGELEYAPARAGGTSPGAAGSGGGGPARRAGRILYREQGGSRG